MRQTLSVSERAQIEGVPFLGWGTHQECTFAGALSAATQVTRYPVHYRTILGVTGLANRVRWYQGPGPKWCPSSPCGETAEAIEAARKALGWSLETDVAFDQPLTASMPKVIDSIDWGLPVLAYDAQMNLGVITGYEDYGETVLMHDYSNPEGPVRRKPSELVRFAIYLGQRHRHLRPCEAAMKGIQLGLEQWTTPHDPVEDMENGYWLGKAAYEKWAEDLAMSNGLDEEQLRSLFFVNWWTFDVLGDTHASAPLFLRDVFAYFPMPVAQMLEAAARLYDESSNVIERCFGQQDVFYGPWTGKAFEDWSPATREREAHVLMTIRGYEDEAMKVLDEALRMFESRV